MLEARSMEGLRLFRIQAYPVAPARHIAAELHVIPGGEERHTAAESIGNLIGALGERFKGGKLKTLPEAAPGPRFGTLALDALADLIGFPADPGERPCAVRNGQIQVVASK